MKTGQFIILFVSCVACVFAQPQAPNVEWSRTYWGDSSESEISGILPMPDGGYMLCGSVLHYRPEYVSDMFLLRTNAEGDCVWSRRYGEGWAVCTAVLSTADGGFVLAGHEWSERTTGSDFVLLKTDAQGDCAWTHTYGRGLHDYCRSVQPTPDGGYLLAGSMDTDTLSYGWLVKTDAAGDSLWSRLYGGGRNGEFEGIQQTGDGGFVLAGTFSGNFWLVRIDQSGDTLWTRTYGGTEMEKCQSVRQTVDGGFILAGWKFPPQSLDEDFWLLKTDADGDSLWSRSYGGPDLRDWCYDVIETLDGGFLLVGRTSPNDAWALDGLAIRTDASGDSLWSIRFGGANLDVFRSGLQTADGGFLCGGYTQGYYFSNALLVKVCPELSVGETPVVPSVCLLTNYPNPFNLATTLSFALPRTAWITIRAYDLLGREVEVIVSAAYRAGAHEIAWTPNNLASSIYWITMNGDGFQLVRKTILLR
ncbi:MAG: hypothetical protein NT025_06465 [bacterium]|nr:hypothetical protein [bacterium]